MPEKDIEMEEEEGEKEEVEAVEPKEIEEAVNTAIESCMEKIKAGEYQSKDEAIDALVADLQSAKDIDDPKAGMKGLGIGAGEQGMSLPEAE